VQAYVFQLFLSRQISVFSYRYSGGVPGRGYLARFEYVGEELPMPMMDGPEDIDMERPFKLRYITFRGGELTGWAEQV
jgi:hypothetical protein